MISPWQLKNFDVPPRHVQPRADQPGTLGQQVEIVGLFLTDPSRKYDRQGAWDCARRLVLEHARNKAT